MKRILRNLLFIINVIVAIALGLAYLSAIISPELFWPLAFFGLAYPYILLANIIFIILWITKRKKAFLLSLLVILLGINQLKNFINLQIRNNDTPANQTTLNILTYNVRLFNHYHWSSEKDMYEKIMAFIHSNQPDVVCLQEFFVSKNQHPTQDDILKLAPQLPYNYIHYHDMSPQNRFGIATLSRYPILHSGTLQFKGSLNLTIYSDIKIGPDTIRVYNNHLQSFRIQNHDIAFIEDLKLEYSEKQLNDAKALSDKLRRAFIERAQQVDFVSEHIHNSPYPVIVCGDFNDTPISYAYHTMRGDLKDSFTEAGFGFSKTYSGRLPSYRIDYILHSKELHTLSHKKHKVDYSDHFPVTATMYLSVPKTKKD